jgi:hypothetical protein
MDDSVLEQVDQSSEHARQDGLIEDFCDGSVFKDHPFFMQYPHALQILAYYDELEVCNPLGSHTKNHKLGIVSSKHKGMLQIPAKDDEFGYSCYCPCC